VRKVLPIWAPPTLPNRLRRLVDRHPRPGEIAGALIMVHDATAERQKRQELEIKTTMIQEVHHRVKNNLQTIAATLRMQVRRTQDPAVADALSEAVGRILSVAVIHEFLSLKESQTINIRDVSQRIVGQNRGIMVPGKQISFSVEGPAIYLPSQQATSCALVVNELVQNALKHGFGGRDQGHIRILLTDGGDQVRLEIRDNGTPLPADFDLDKSNSMGLQIVRTLVEGDLRGTVRMENQGDEVVAAVSFPKITVAEE
jgi:two-component sensor histidine kinase